MNEILPEDGTAGTLIGRVLPDFVERLIAARKRAGVTQAVLAERLGKPQSFISKSERLERRVDVAEFRDMMIAIGCDPVAEFAAVHRES